MPFILYVVYQLVPVLRLLLLFVIFKPDVDREWWDQGPHLAGTTDAWSGVVGKLGGFTTISAQKSWKCDVLRIWLDTCALVCGIVVYGANTQYLTADLDIGLKIIKLLSHTLNWKTVRRLEEVVWSRRHHKKLLDITSRQENQGLVRGEIKSDPNVNIISTRCRNWKRDT